MTQIATERLLLRAPVLEDAGRISLLAGDYDVASMTGTIPHPYSEAMAADWIAPNGFARPLPAISGAEPCTGS